MKRTLLVKLLVCYLLVAVSMFTLLNTYGVNRLKNSIVERQKTVLHNEAATISSEYMEDYYLISSPGLMQNVLTQLKTIDSFLNTRIWIVNKNGTITMDTRSTYSSEAEINLNELDPDFLSTTFSDNTYFEGILSEPMLSVVYPISYNYGIRGYIVMLTSLSSIKHDSIYYMDIINICFLLFLILMIFVFMYIYYLTVRPLKKVIKAAVEYSSGHFDYPLKIETTDEYKELSDAVTYMASELNSLDDYQKKFVANISHDFRSPLTSIKGYIEAIQDGTIPPEMQGKYLDIVLFEAERLTKLTTNLLALNTFDNNGTILEISSFDINLIIKQTAATFEGICTKKKISFKLVFSDRETFVDADHGKIQQVLYNLIDNAIKFSHQNSTIKVSTEVKGDKVFVAVKDYGVGIPKESVKKIWERFYKSDPSRGKDKKGTGLGLSITKEIINAHNENINVISTENVGTEFTFTLPKTKL
ncbi:HAMP domain-containing sensor histidine kinase [Anaerosporobacter sp.]